MNEDPEAVRAGSRIRMRVWRKKNPERNKELQNSESNKQAKKDWAKRNVHKMVAKTAKRRATKIKATPAWFSSGCVNKLYKKCSAMSKQSGVLHHVDHSVPLVSERVCGLHVIDNLQILTAEENRRKSNNFYI